MSNRNKVPSDIENKREYDISFYIIDCAKYIFGFSLGFEEDRKKLDNILLNFPRRLYINTKSDQETIECAKIILYNVKKIVTVTMMNPKYNNEFKKFMSKKNEVICVEDEGRYLEIFGININDNNS